MNSKTMQMPPPRALDRFQRVRRAVLFVMVCVAATVLLFFRSSYGAGALHEGIKVAGVCLIAVAIVGRLWSTLYIGGRKGAELVSAGPFSMTRNPLYLFSAIGAAGIGAQTGSLVVALIFALVTAAAFYVVILREEGFLRQQFGDAYEAYRARVPRFFPSLSRFEDTDEVTIKPRRLYATLADGLVFLVAIPVFEAIEWLHASGLVAVYFHLP